MLRMTLSRAAVRRSMPAVEARFESSSKVGRWVDAELEPPDSAIARRISHISRMSCGWGESSSSRRSSSSSSGEAGGAIDVAVVADVSRRRLRTEPSAKWMANGLSAGWPPSKAMRARIAEPWSFSIGTDSSHSTAAGSMDQSGGTEPDDFRQHLRDRRRRAA